MYSLTQNTTDSPPAILWALKSWYARGHEQEWRRRHSLEKAGKRGQTGTLGIKAEKTSPAQQTCFFKETNVYYFVVL